MELEKKYRGATEHCTREPERFSSRKMDKFGVCTDLGLMRILYADDEEVIRRLVLKYLEPCGCILEICENGERAVACYKTASYDLVLMDMQMPVMDGLTATRALRAWEKDVRAITEAWGCLLR